MTATSGSFRLVRVLSWRRIVDRPLRSAMTAMGVAVGVAFLFSILSLNAQVAASARDTATLLAGPGLLQVTPTSPSGLSEDLAPQLAADPRIVTAAPIVIARATASSATQETGVFVMGLGPETAELAPDVTESVEIDAFDQAAFEGATPGLALNRSLARRLHLAAGDELTVHASTGQTVLRVVAVVSALPFDRVNGGMVAAMPLADAQALFGRTGRADQILLRAEPDVDLTELRRDVAASVEGVGVVGSPGETDGPDSVYFALIRAFTNFVGGFVLIAAVMLVFHTMSTATAERRTEIALARSIGSSRRQLLAVTLAEAAFLGAVGTVVGLVAGALLARFVVPLTHYLYDLGAPVDVPTEVRLQIGPAVVAAIAGVAGAVAGALLPARAAAGATPIDAFRPTANYEWHDPLRPRREVAVALLGAAVVAAGIILAIVRRSEDPTDIAVLAPVFIVDIGALIFVPTAIPIVARGAARLVERLSKTTGRHAADALRTNPRRTTVNVMALLVPVAAVVLTAVAFGSGLTETTRLAQANVGTPINVDADSYIGVLGAQVAAQPLAPDSQPALEAVPGVRAVLPYQNANVTLPDGTPAGLYAIPLTAAERADVADMVRFPDLADDAAAFAHGLRNGQIAASKLAARTLDLAVGSQVSFPTGSGSREFTVAALFDDWAFESTFVVDLDTYRATWADGDAYRYAIVPTPGTNLAELRARLEAAVAATAMPAHVRTRDDAIAELEANGTIFLPLTRAMTLASLLFAALALGNAAFTAVTEQRWNLALKRALGMSRRQITRSLALEAVTVGLIGAIGGVVVGVGLGVFGLRVLGYQVALTLPLTIPWNYVVASLVLGVVVAVSATSYPRRLARRIPIIESLRFE